MMWSVLALALLCFGAYFLGSNGFAIMATREYCDKEIKIGSMVMGNILQYDEKDTRSLRIISGSRDVANNTYIDCSSPISVYLEPKIYHMLLETSENAYFTGGSCNKRRTTSNGAQLVVKDKDIDEDIVISCTWGQSYSDGLRMTKPFSFRCMKASYTQESL